MIGDTGTLQRSGARGDLVRIGGGKVEPVNLELNLPPGTAEMRMYAEFFRDIRERKASPIGLRAALEPAKIAYASDLSIRENRIVTARDFA